MDSKNESDSDNNIIFLKNETKDVAALTRPEFFEIKNRNISEEKTIIYDARVNEETEEISLPNKLWKRTVLCEVEEEDENKLILNNGKRSPSGYDDISQTYIKKKFGKTITSSPTKKNKNQTQFQTNLITNYFSLGERTNIPKNKITEFESIPDSPRSFWHQGPFNTHKRIKLNSVKASAVAAETQKLSAEVQIQEKMTVLNNENDLSNNVNYKCNAKSPVKNEYSYYYWQSLKEIVQYEINKQSTLQVETLAQHKKFENLFSSEELDYFQKFFELPKEACLLFARMLCRKKDWHRVSAIEYRDISHNIEEEFKILGKHSFFDLNIESESMELLLELLNKKEIHSLGKKFNMKVENGKSNKKSLIDTILKNCKTQRSAVDMLSKNNNNNNNNNISRRELVKDNVLKHLGSCAKINSSALSAFNHLLLLFSLPHGLTEEDKWNSEIQTMIGFILKKVCYPSYKAQPTVIFETRDDFMSYEKAVKLLREYEVAAENKNYPECSFIGQKAVEEFDGIIKDEEFKKKFMTLPCYLKKFSAGTVYAKILTHYCEQNKRKKDPEELINILENLINQRLFLVVRKGDWYNSLVQAYENAGKPEKAVATLRLALKDEEINDVQRLVLKLKGLGMLKKKKNNIGNLALKEDLGNLCTMTLTDPPKLEIKARALEGNERGSKIVYVEESKTQKTYSSVEEYAISYYKKNGFTEGIHSEGSIIQTTYFLIFFDIIYGISPPGVFQSCYQKEPLDLFSRSFYLNRKDAIDARLKDIRTWTINDFERVIDKVIAENEGKNCVITWENCYDTTFFCDIVKCLGLEKLAIICERLVRNFKVYRSGFPDLTLWNPKTGKYKFVEVKSPNDKLSANQRLWLDFLGKHNINCEVCYLKDKAFPNTH